MQSIFGCDLVGTGLQHVWPMPSSWLQGVPCSKLWETFSEEICANGILLSVQCCTLSSIDFPEDVLYHVLVKLVSPVPQTDLNSCPAIHFIKEGCATYQNAFTLVICIFLLKTIM